MDDEEFADWQLCWQANLYFFRPVINPQRCILCEETSSYPQETRRSAFWLEATRCSAGHRQATQNEIHGTPHPGVCSTCDQSYILDTLKGKHVCRREGCRRVVRVNEVEVKARLKYDTEFLEKFLDLIKKYNVFECAIHCDDVAFDSTAPTAYKGPSLQCDHDRNVCDDCLKATFENAIRGGRLEDLICPDVECKKPVGLDVIRPNVSTDVFKIYNKHLALKTMSKDKRFRWCECGHGQIHAAGESNPEWNCLVCNKRRCYICRDDSSGSCNHLKEVDAQKLTTKELQRKAAAKALSKAAREAAETQRKAREKEADTKREIARTTKKCPKAGCANPIERNAGCGHFTCKICRAEFCWSCKVIWKNGQARHLADCRIPGTSTTVTKESLDLTEYAPGWDVDEGYDLSLDKDVWLIAGHR